MPEGPHRSQRELFISHATEDKDDLVRPLAEALVRIGIEVWYDENSIQLGESIRTSIDRALAGCRFSLVVLSRSFFEKPWAVWELNALMHEEASRKTDFILPIWHQVTREDVARFSPLLIDRKAIFSSDGLDVIVAAVVRVLRPGETGLTDPGGIRRPSSTDVEVNATRPIKMERVLKKGRRWTREKPTLIAVDAEARSEMDASALLELIVAFPVHRVTVGFVEKMKVAIGCTEAHLRVVNQNAAFTAWHDSAADSTVIATKLSSAEVEWLLQLGSRTSDSRLLVGDRRLWVKFSLSQPVVIVANLRPNDRRVFVDDQRLGLRTSMALMGKLLRLLSHQISLPDDAEFEEDIKLLAIDQET
jgi:hypothetical protein